MAARSASSTSPWRVNRNGKIALAVSAGLVVVAAGSWFVTTVLPGLTASSPISGRELYVDTGSSAAAALLEQVPDSAAAVSFETLASTPSAIWLVPEEHPTAEIGGYLAETVGAAAVDDQLPVFVVYGIPGRDCGNASAGGLSEAEYPEWISAIATGLGSSESIVILEPDSLALADECGNTEQRVDQLQTAITRLEDSGAVIYLDGGHSNWHPASEMAPLLTSAGIDRVRGFATNVSNFNTTADERRYASALSSLVGGAHYVVDTSRNGNGSDGEWCNPSGRAVGDYPNLDDSDSVFDANLWIKTPGESDGPCNGGPAAGVWWPEGAIALTSD